MDPHGIYGTRSANRVRMLQRRRLIQNLGLLGLLVAVPLIMVLYTRLPRASVMSSFWLASPVAEASAPAALVEGENFLVPTATGKLVAVNARAGTQRDVFATAFPLRAQPLIDGDMVFVPCEDGAVYAVDWRRGRMLWSYQSSAAVTARPALAEVRLPSADAVGSPSATNRTNNITPNTDGTVLRDRTAATALLPDSSTIVGSATIRLQRVILVGNDEGMVTALARGTGKVLWKRNLGAPVGNGITIATRSDGRVCALVPLLGGVSTRGGVQCLDGSTGKPLWCFPVDNTIYAAQLPPPAVIVTADGRTLVYCVDDAGTVVCLDALTGKKVWKKFVRPLPGGTLNPDAMASLRAEPLLISGNGGMGLIVGGNDGGVRYFDARTGQLRWEIDAGSPVCNRPLELHMRNGEQWVLIGTEGSIQLLLDAKTGRVVSRMAISGTGFAGAMVINNELVLLDSQGHLEKYNLPFS